MTSLERVHAITHWILPSQGRAVRLPAGWRLGDCRFERQCDQLVLSDGAGRRIVLRGYYDRETAPDLRDDHGMRLPGELARLMAGLSARAQELVMADGFGRRRSGEVA